MPVQYARCSGTSPHAACLTCSRPRCTAAPSQVSARARGIVSAVDSRRHAATAQSARSRVSASAALHGGESCSALLHGHGHARMDVPPLARGQSEPISCHVCRRVAPGATAVADRAAVAGHGHRARPMGLSSGPTAGGRPGALVGCVRTPLAQLGGRRYARAGLLASRAKGWGSFGVY